MKKKMLKLVISISALLITYVGSAQCGKQAYYGTGEDSVECMKNLSVYGVYYQQNNYKDALPSWQKVLNGCPCATKNVFIHGEKMYKYYLDEAKDATKKEELLDSLMLIYDKRIESYGQKGYVLGKKGSDLLKYNPTRYEESYTILKQSIMLSKNQSKASSISAYFQAAVFKYKQGSLTQIEAIELYNQLIQICESNISNGGKDNDNYESAKDALNKLFIEDIKPDCATMVSILKPKFDATPNDVELLKKIISSLSNCKDEELYVNAVVKLAEIEPSAEAFQNLGKMFYSKGDINTAKEYYLKAIEIETDNGKKADLYYELSAVVIKNMQLSASYAQQAVNLNPKHGKALLMIARQYASGAGACASGKEQEEYEKKCVYWVVVDYCIKAKSVDPSVSSEANSMISTYSAQFPGNEEIFFNSEKIGDSKTISCWFTATTTIRERK